MKSMKKKQIQLLNPQKYNKTTNKIKNKLQIRIKLINKIILLPIK